MLGIGPAKETFVRRLNYSAPFQPGAMDAVPSAEDLAVTDALQAEKNVTGMSTAGSLQLTVKGAGLAGVQGDECGTVKPGFGPLWSAEEDGRVSSIP